MISVAVAVVIALAGGIVGMALHDPARKVLVYAAAGVICAFAAGYIWGGEVARDRIEAVMRDAGPKTQETLVVNQQIREAIERDSVPAWAGILVLAAALILQLLALLAYGDIETQAAQFAIEDEPGRENAGRKANQVRKRRARRR